MQPHAANQPSNPLLTDDVRRYLGSLRGGFRAWSFDKRSMLARIHAKSRWEARRAKYGPSGQRERSYKQWRAERNKPAIGEDGREIKDPASPSARKE